MNGPKLARDPSRGVPCPPEDVLRLVVEAPIGFDTLPSGITVGTVFEVSVTPFWIGVNRGCFPDRPNDLVLDDAGRR